MHSSSVASLTQKLREALLGGLSLVPPVSGDIAEHWVAMLAAWKGAEVYPNLNCTGPTDFIMVVDGVPYQLDVKLARPNSRGSWRGNTDKVEDPSSLSWLSPRATSPNGRFSGSATGIRKSWRTSGTNPLSPLAHESPEAAS